MLPLKADGPYYEVLVYSLAGRIGLDRWGVTVAVSCRVVELLLEILRKRVPERIAPGAHCLVTSQAKNSRFVPEPGQGAAALALPDWPLGSIYVGPPSKAAKRRPTQILRPAYSEGATFLPTDVDCALKHPAFPF